MGMPLAVGGVYAIKFKQRVVGDEEPDKDSAAKSKPFAVKIDRVPKKSKFASGDKLSIVSIGPGATKHKTAVSFGYLSTIVTRQLSEEEELAVGLGIPV